MEFFAYGKNFFLPHLPCRGRYEGVTDTYTSVDGRTVAMGAYCRKSLFEYFDGEEIIAITKQGMPFYETQFRLPYPFRKYDQIFVPEYNARPWNIPAA